MSSELLCQTAHSDQCLSFIFSTSFFHHLFLFGGFGGGVVVEEKLNSL